MAMFAIALTIVPTVSPSISLPPHSPPRVVAVLVPPPRPHAQLPSSLSITVVNDDRRRYIHFLVVVVVLFPVASPSQFPASSVLIVKFAATMPRQPRIATTANRRRTRDARRRRPPLFAPPRRCPPSLRRRHVDGVAHETGGGDGRKRVRGVG